MKVIINAYDGTVVDLKGSYLVDLDLVSEEHKPLWEEVLTTNSDRAATALAVLEGIPLVELIHNNTK